MSEEELKQQLEQERATVAKLRELFKVHGGHGSYCDGDFFVYGGASEENWQKCNCGLKELVEANPNNWLQEKLDQAVKAERERLLELHRQSNELIANHYSWFDGNLPKSLALSLHKIDNQMKLLPENCVQLPHIYKEPTE